MENIEIARVLAEYADLLDISGGNFFQVRSYRDAARSLSDLSRPITQILDSEEDLRKLPGVGKGMADHIREIIETGSFANLETIQEKVPRTLVQLLQLEGLLVGSCNLTEVIATAATCETCFLHAVASASVDIPV